MAIGYHWPIHVDLVLIDDQYLDFLYSYESFVEFKKSFDQILVYSPSDDDLILKGVASGGFVPSQTRSKFFLGSVPRGVEFSLCSLGIFPFFLSLGF